MLSVIIITVPYFLDHLCMSQEFFPFVYIFCFLNVVLHILKFVQISEYSHFFHRFFSFLTCSFPDLPAFITHTVVLTPPSPHPEYPCHQSVTASFHAVLQADTIFCVSMCVCFICPRDFFLGEGEDSLNLWNSILAAVEISSSFLTIAFALFSILF